MFVFSTTQAFQLDFSHSYAKDDNTLVNIDGTTMTSMDHRFNVSNLFDSKRNTFLKALVPEGKQSTFVLTFPKRYPIQAIAVLYDSTLAAVMQATADGVAIPAQQAQNTFRFELPNTRVKEIVIQVASANDEALVKLYELQVFVQGSKKCNKQGLLVDQVCVCAAQFTGAECNLKIDDFVKIDLSHGEAKSAYSYEAADHSTVQASGALWKSPVAAIVGAALTGLEWVSNKKGAQQVTISLWEAKQVSFVRLVNKVQQPIIPMDVTYSTTDSDQFVAVKKQWKAKQGLETIVFNDATVKRLRFDLTPKSKNDVAHLGQVEIFVRKPTPTNTEATASTLSDDDDDDSTRTTRASNIKTSNEPTEACGIVCIASIASSSSFVALVAVVAAVVVLAVVLVRVKKAREEEEIRKRFVEPYSAQ